MRSVLVAALLAAVAVCTGGDAGARGGPAGVMAMGPDQILGWSGRHIAFRRWAPGRPRFQTWVMRADGTGRRALARRYLTWSPDGRRLNDQPQGRIGGGFESDRFLVVDVDTNRRRWISGVRPVWSPDGERLAVSSYSGPKYDQHWSIWVVEADGTGRRFLASGYFLAWSPDGSRILFRRTGSKRQGLGLFVVNRDGSQLRRLVKGDLLLDGKWSPDGRLVAFSELRVYRGAPGTKQFVRVIGSDGRRERWLGEGDNPQWSASGKYLSFSRPYGFRIVDRGGRIVRRIRGYIAGPWAPHGDLLLVHGIESLQRHAIVDPVDGSRVMLSRGFAFMWSPDGTSLAFSRRPCGLRQGIYVVGVDGRGLRRIVDNCTIVGSQKPNVLFGRIGTDTIHAQEGDDVIDTRGGRRDRILCGDGHDIVRADRIDAVADDCERVRRR